MEKITREEYNELHDDYKMDREDGTHSILKLVDGQTVSIPVEIVD